MQLFEENAISDHAQSLLDSGADVAIVSGEGSGPGSAERYTGKRTREAIARRLVRARSDEEHWAFVVIRDGDHAIKSDWFGDFQPCEFPAVD